MTYSARAHHIYVSQQPRWAILYLGYLIESGVGGSSFDIIDGPNKFR